jgi:hypothetical protein
VRIDSFLGNGHETNNRTTIVAKKQLGKHIAGAMDARARIQVLLRSGGFYVTHTEMSYVRELVKCYWGRESSQFSESVLSSGFPGSTPGLHWF